MQKKKIVSIISWMIIVIVMCICMNYDWHQLNDYKQYNTSSLSYVSATVLSIEKENLTKDSDDGSRYYGTQQIIVKIDEGKYEGEKKEIINYLSTSSNVRVWEGARVIICVDAPQNAEPYFTVYNYNRSISIGMIFMMFVAGMLLVGGKKGINSLAALILTMFFILGILIPAIYHGINVILITSITLLGVIFTALYVMNGIEKKTVLFAASTASGILVGALFCAVSEKLLRINGYHFPEAESLLLISQSTGLQVKQLLFAGVLISSLGAVMDVGVSIVSSLYEVKRANPSQESKDLFKAGMNIGKDMIGTMSNTLILAFTGSSLTTMLLLMAFGYQPVQLLNSDYLAIELVKAISSTFAVVMTVPTAAVISAAFIKKSDVEG